MSGANRLRQLESLLVDNGSPHTHLKLAELLPSGKFLSIETLTDCMMVLYDECCNSSLRREKTVSDFIELGELGLSFPLSYGRFNL